jgi:hypothetical protein
MDNVEVIKIDANKRIVIWYDDMSDYMYEELWQEITFITNHRDYKSQGPLADSELEDIDLEIHDIVPITAYIHSGIALYIGHSRPCEFDSGCLGHIIFKKGEFGDNNRGLKPFVNNWASILNGQIYGISFETKIELFDKAGNKHSETWQVEDSCGGFIWADRPDMFNCINETFGLELTGDKS